ncbi:hypothetical protein HRI_004016000 [Hibiscus trionum]|uniref:Uncharacterized protein n=1 Tax=Hibiscus trionum TaxID=183268 RepID=A0A9W7IVQ7_HIBTR|nr:hypothetical protein HRI_004016000 [Hibiscus trionum]
MAEAGISSPKCFNNNTCRHRINNPNLPPSLHLFQICFRVSFRLPEVSHYSDDSSFRLVDAKSPPRPKFGTVTVGLRQRRQLMTMRSITSEDAIQSMLSDSMEKGDKFIKFRSVIFRWSTKG